ncbi:MAG: hypothetical protein KIT09_25000 [Bryobacteraceae bacterium]|nr:hypothetical protein [Bryobacteraceae bacterium]
MTITRRMLFSAGGALLAISRAVGAGEFWNEKKPSEWTDEEVERLLTRSPWAKEVEARFDSSNMERPPGGMGGDTGGGGMGGRGGAGGGFPGGGGIGFPGGGGMGGPGIGGPGMGGPPPVKAVVRWDSALPIREVMHKQDDAAAAEAYLVSVIGMPMMSGRPRRGGERGEDTEERRKAMAERVRAATRLERKGKDPIYADSVEFIERPPRAARCNSASAATIGPSPRRTSR